MNNEIFMDTLILSWSGLIFVLTIKKRKLVKKREIGFLERMKREIGRENWRESVFLVI